jgi:hypothetical protein
MTRAGLSHSSFLMHNTSLRAFAPKNEARHQPKKDARIFSVGSMRDNITLYRLYIVIHHLDTLRQAFNIF